MYLTYSFLTRGHNNCSYYPFCSLASALVFLIWGCWRGSAVRKHLLLIQPSFIANPILNLWPVNLSLLFNIKAINSNTIYLKFYSRQTLALAPVGSCALATRDYSIAHLYKLDISYIKYLAQIL